MKEIWKEIINYENKYWVSNLGRIKSNYSGGKIISFQKNEDGYFKVSLYKKGKTKSFLVHRLVALHFIPNPRGVNTINHIDGNKENNCVDNLEWCTQKENMIHAEKNGLLNHPFGANSGKSTSFFQFSTKGELIKHWGCINDCARFLYEHNLEAKKFSNVRSLAACISKNLNLKQHICCGYIFSFYPEINIKEYKSLNKRYKRCKPIIAIDKKTGETYNFPSIRSLNGKIMPNGLKVEATYICKTCKGKRKSHGGYYWRYLRETN